MALRQNLVNYAEKIIAGSLALTIGVLAYIHPGVAVADVDLHDGGVWITNKRERLVGHLNYPSRIIDSGLRSATPDFDVIQFNKEITYTDTKENAFKKVNPAEMLLDAGPNIASSFKVESEGGTWVITDFAKGRAWVTDTDNFSSFNPGSKKPLISKDPKLLAAVSKSGKVFALSPLNKYEVIKSDAGWEVTSTAIDPASDAGVMLTNKGITLSTVGDKVVAYDPATGKVLLPDLSVVGGPIGGRLQAPGDKAKHLNIAAPSQLVQVNVIDGTIKTFDAGSGNATGNTIDPVDSSKPKGNPAEPVHLGTCDYSAWGGTGNFLRLCSDGTPTQFAQTAELAKSEAPVFRVNRNVIVLNDIENGSLWLPDHKMVLIDDWKQVISQLEEQESLDKAPTMSEDEDSKKDNEENSPPVAVDDNLGARAGRTTTLPVVANDSDPDGDVLVAIPDGQPQVGSVYQVRSGEALQIDLPPEATGTANFTYTVNDGRGGTAQAAVTVNIMPEDANSPPVQLRTSTVEVVAKGKTTYNPLPDFQDPEGDIVFLSDASGEGLNVRFQENGKIFVEDITGKPGTRELLLKVSDGEAETEGKLILNVLDSGQYPPLLRSDHAFGVTGQDISIYPLLNDVDPNGDTLHLLSVEDVPTNTTVIPDINTGRINFLANEEGSYVFGYTVSDGPSTAKSTVRVDVVKAKEDVLPPIVENDQVYLPEGGVGLSDLLINDIDPNGGVLVVQETEVEKRSGLVVQMLDHSIARVTSTKPLRTQTKFKYKVSNGAKTSVGQVTVLPVPPVSSNALPEAYPDSAKVRQGDIVSVHVLDNDRSPSGSALMLDPKLDTTISGNEGEVFVSGDTVRFKAGDVPGTFYANYTVRDTNGNIASATITFQVIAMDEANNRAPTPMSLSSRVLAGSTVKIDVPLDGVDPDGDSVSVVGLEKAPTLGTVETLPTGFIYKADPKKSGTDTFTYELKDRLGKKGVGQIRVGVAPSSGQNQVPVAADDYIRVKPRRELAIAVLANDVDPDGDDLTVISDSILKMQEGAEPVPATDVTIDQNRFVLLSSATAGTTRYSYRITDGKGGESSAQVTIEVDEEAPAIAPIARDDHIAFEEALKKRKVQVRVLDNDDDPDGSIRDVKLESSSPNAVVQSDKTMMVTVIKEPQIIMYSITDPDNQVGRAAIYVPGVDPDRTPPSLITKDLPLKTKGAEKLTINLADYVKVRSGRSPRITEASKVTAGPGWDGSAIVIDPTTLQYTPELRFTGKTSITAEITDGADLNDPQAITTTLVIPIEVEVGANLPPTFKPTRVQVAAGEEAITVPLEPFIDDPNGDDPAKMKYAVTSSPEGIVATISGSSVTIKADVSRPKGFAGEVGLSVDDGSEPVNATMPVEVTGSSRPLITVSNVTIDNAFAGKTESVDISKHITNPFPGKPVTVIGAPIVTEGSATVSAKGTTINITPTPGFPGQVSVTYVVGDATNDPDRHVSGKITLIVSDRPDPPTNVYAEVQGAGTASVQWQSGAANGKPITGAIVRDSVSGKEFKCSGASCVLTGLQNGVSHSFSVASINAVGRSEFSAPSSSVHLDVAPDTPGAPSVQAGDRTVTASWTPPRSAGSAITYYTVYLQGSSNAYQEVSGTSATFNGVENGGTYWVSIQAHNLNPEPSRVSEDSAKVVPFGAPNPVKNVTLTPSKTGDSANGQQVTVTWKPPSLNNGLNNGAEILDYTVTLVGGDGVNETRKIDSTGKQVTFTAPNSPTPYVATVTTSTRGGVSSPASSTPTRIYGQPSRITVELAATGTTGEVKIVSILPPTTLNGWSMEEISYEVDGHRVSAGDVLKGYSNGQSVVLTAYAVGSGSGEQIKSEASSTNQVVPFGAPKEVTVKCTPEFGKVTCTVSGDPSNGRNAQIYAGENEGSMAPMGDNTHVFTDLTPGVEKTWCAQGRYDGSGNSMTGPVACAKAVSADAPEPKKPHIKCVADGHPEGYTDGFVTCSWNSDEPDVFTPTFILQMNGEESNVGRQGQNKVQVAGGTKVEGCLSVQHSAEMGGKTAKACSSATAKAQPKPPPPPAPLTQIVWGDPGTSQTGTCTRPQDGCNKIIAVLTAHPNGGSNCELFANNQRFGIPKKWYPNGTPTFTDAYGGRRIHFTLRCDDGINSEILGR